MEVGGKTYQYFSLPDAQAAGVGDVDRLPMSLKILLENLLRFEDDNTVKTADILALGGWATNPPPSEEIAYRPARVLMRTVSPSGTHFCRTPWPSGNPRTTGTPSGINASRSTFARPAAAP